ncbi:MAG: hypothetical protein US54_C0016G0003 [Candidatus Roizmanbacteria bacterium GW2011_GWA2_37_7]|uniref:Uncharacterized protein n=1 Tax=Candidatus Roizmanbacteria bacterium GW2011_GWA2_37_7 TaxID=1618481 RepID=A0A0G0H7Q9_9BACT|nr:MAG: hypothetical protein US54_C0016G0003 [Candidatus Roizmanbacteria bacterium GW2011_GWA2_37_7]
MLIILLLIVGVSFVTFTKQQYSADTRVFADIPDSLTSTIVVPGLIKTEFMDSPDGTETLTMERQEKGDKFRYSFFTSDTSKEAQQFIYTKELTLSYGQLSIPYNTWSPDNTYFFIKESTASQNNYYVFFASGENFSDYSQYLDIQRLFEEKIQGFTISDVTGWAAPTLLIINTQEQEGEQKVSFWFDVQTQSFTRLGTYFK